MAASFESTGRNQKDLRLTNRALVFRTIREAEPISRAELAKITGLNPATITHITRELIEQNLLEDAGVGESRGGRPTSLLKVHTRAGFVIAVQLDRLFIRGMLTDLELHDPIYDQVIAENHTNPADINLDALINLIRRLVDQANHTSRTLMGVGICAPGPLDSERGVLLSPPNFPGWYGTPLREIIQQELGLAILLDQDANACALAEKWFGLARELDNFVFILADAGLGGAFFLNGDIYRGRHDIAGELGHATIDLNGPQCACGNHGCLELYASPRSVEGRVIGALMGGQKSAVLDLAGGHLEAVSFPAIVQAARQGDSVCLPAIQGMARALGVGIVNILNTYDPEAVILGGKIALARDLIEETLQENIRVRTLTGATRPIPLLFSNLNQEAPIIGAYSLVLRELFQNPPVVE